MYNIINKMKSMTFASTCYDLESIACKKDRKMHLEMDGYFNSLEK